MHKHIINTANTINTMSTTFHDPSISLTAFTPADSVLDVFDLVPVSPASPSDRAGALVGAAACKLTVGLSVEGSCG